MELMETQGATLWYGLFISQKTSLTVQMETNAHELEQIARAAVKSSTCNVKRCSVDCSGGNPCVCRRFTCPEHWL